MLTFKKSALSSWEKWRWKLLLAWTQITPTLHLPTSPLTHLTDSHSEPWAPVWNQHWACRKWEIFTGDRGGREGGGGDKRKTAERTIDLTFGIQMSTLLVMVLLPFPLSPPSLVFLSLCVCLHEHLLGVCVHACSCACVDVVSLKGSPYEKLRACCSFLAQ